MHKVFLKCQYLLSETEIFPMGRVITRSTFEKPELAGTETRKVVPGRMVITDDGQMDFVPYEQTGTNRYTTVVTTEHGSAKKYRNSTVVSFRFSNAQGIRNMLHSVLEEGFLMLRLLLNKDNR